jgi:hypothetical protein
MSTGVAVIRNTRQRSQPRECEPPVKLPQTVFTSRSGQPVYRLSAGAACNGAAGRRCVEMEKSRPGFFDHGHFVTYIHRGY